MTAWGISVAPAIQRSCNAQIVGSPVPRPKQYTYILASLHESRLLSLKMNGQSSSSSRASRKPLVQSPQHFLLASPIDSLTTLFPSIGSSQKPSGSTPYTLPFPSSSNGNGKGKKPIDVNKLLLDPIAVGVLSAVTALAVAGGGWYGYRTLWRRIKNVNDVTGSMLDRKKWIRGVVTSVGDGGE